MEPLTRPAPPPWSCTGSVLVGSLGVTHIFTGPRANCVPVHPCRALARLGSRTTGNGWFLEMQTGPPKQLRTIPKSAEPSGDGVSTPLEVLLETARRLPDWTLPGCGWHEGTSDGSDSRGGSVNRLAGWYTQWSQYCPYGQECPCPEGNLWGGSRQGMLHSCSTVGDLSIPLTHCAVVCGSPAGGRGIREYHIMPG